MQSAVEFTDVSVPAMEKIVQDWLEKPVVIIPTHKDSSSITGLVGGNACGLLPLFEVERPRRHPGPDLSRDFQRPNVAKLVNAMHWLNTNSWRRVVPK